MTRTEYWPCSEGLHVVEITTQGVRVVRVLHCCKVAAALIKGM